MDTKLYKSHRSFHERSDESRKMLSKNKDTIPVIIEKLPGEMLLPMIDKRKYLISKDTQMIHIIGNIRSRLQLHPNQAMYFLAADNVMVTPGTSIDYLYKEYKDEDGFLYIKYAAQETYG